MTRNEILYSLNKPEDYILGIVEFLDGGEHRVRYVREPFQRKPDFGATSVNYDFAQLLARGGGAGITWLADDEPRLRLCDGVNPAECRNDV